MTVLNVHHTNSFGSFMTGARIQDLLAAGTDENRECIGRVLFCHLLIEQMLYEILTYSCSASGVVLPPRQKMTFATKVSKCRTNTLMIDGEQRAILSAPLAEAILELNSLRNSLAHEYNFVPDSEIVHGILKSLNKAGVDFTDNLADSLEVAHSLGYDKLAMIEEATKHLFFELAFVLREAGGADLVG